MIEKLNPVKFAFPIMLVLASWLNSPAVSKVELTSQANTQRPTPPRTGTPKGNPTPGTTRPETSCKDTDQTLTALFANNELDYSHSEYPSFWFYIPYNPNDIHQIEFLLLDSRERQTIYRTGVELTEGAGVIQIEVPRKKQPALKLHKIYRWYLKLDCNPNKSNEPDLVVDGWLRRMPLNASLPDPSDAITFQNYLFYRENNLWYDAINTLAQLHFTNSDNHRFSSAWVDLLNSFGSGKVAPEEMVNSELYNIEIDD